MYENKKISLIIDKNFPDLYFFSQSDFLFGEKQWKSFVKNVKKLQISKKFIFLFSSIIFLVDFRCPHVSDFWKIETVFFRQIEL